MRKPSSLINCVKKYHSILIFHFMNGTVTCIRMEAIIEMQIQADGSLCVIAFASCALTLTQQNSHIIPLEALAFIWALGHFHVDLSHRPFLWRTDHRALKFIFNASHTKIPVLQRYKLIADEYNFLHRMDRGFKNDRRPPLATLHNSLRYTFRHDQPAKWLWRPFTITMLISIVSKRSGHIRQIIVSTSLNPKLKPPLGAKKRHLRPVLHRENRGYFHSRVSAKSIIRADVGRITEKAKWPIRQPINSVKVIHEIFDSQVRSSEIKDENSNLRTRQVFSGIYSWYINVLNSIIYVKLYRSTNSMVTKSGRSRSHRHLFVPDISATVHYDLAHMYCDVRKSQPNHYRMRAF